MNRFACVITHNRPELLRQTWEAIGPQVEMVIILDNASDPPVDHRFLHASGWRTAVVKVPDQPPNLSKLWRLGITLITGLLIGQDNKHDAHIAMLCDDAPPPAGWYEAVVEAMRSTGAAIGASSPWGWSGPPRIQTAPGGNIAERMPGHAWILDPSSSVRPDEQFEWWWGDTDIDFRARQNGGMVMIGTHPVHNIHPNEFSNRPEQQAQTGRDTDRFVARWGPRPW